MEFGILLINKHSPVTGNARKPPFCVSASCLILFRAHVDISNEIVSTRLN